MPYFKWVGVNISGDIKKGRLVAYSAHELSRRLFQRGIALLQCKSYWTASFLWREVAVTRASLFDSIARLLRAGLMMPDVFIIAAEQCQNPFLYDALCTCAMDIKNGVAFADALKKQQYIADDLASTMLIVGYESGTLVTAVENVAVYYHMKDVFAKGMRSALALPALTFVFFIAIAFFIFAFIMPRFADMFVSMNVQLPSITQRMLDLSYFVSSWSMVYYSVFFVSIVFCVVYYFRNSGAYIWDTLVMKMPLIKHIVHYHELGQVLYALALLEKSSVPLVQSLHILQPLMHNHVIKKYIHALSLDVQSGVLLSHAMENSLMFSSDVIALIAIGEESGALPEALLAAADLYRDSAQSLLRRFVFFLQPIAIIFLGILIGMLILAVYVPIMNLSYSL